jgi:hypothetical protein
MIINHNPQKKYEENVTIQMRLAESPISGASGLKAGHGAAFCYKRDRLCRGGLSGCPAFARKP